MKKAIILHGTFGSPDGNWFRWLERELVAKGFEVCVPTLPTPEGQSVTSWFSALKDQLKFDIDSDTYIFGHSCGATFLAHLLETLNSPVAAAIFASPVMNLVGHPDYDSLNSSFINHEFNWAKIAENMGNAHILHGDNDPYVANSQPIYLAKNINLDVEFIHDGGHLNAETGYTSFPRLLEFV